MAKKDGTCDTSIACIPSLKISADHNVFSTGVFELGKALEMQPYLLEHVLRYLDYTSLQTVKTFNNVWEELAIRELNKRDSCGWINCCKTPVLCSLHTSQDLNYNNVKLGIVAFSSSVVRLHEYVCLHDSINLARMPFAEYLSKDVIPEGVQYCAISCSGLNAENTVDKSVSSLYQAIFLPHIPNITISTFYVNSKDLRINVPNVAEKEVVCMLMFTHRYSKKLAENLLSTVLHGRGIDSMAVGGGLIKSVKAFPMIQQVVLSQALYCVAFTKDKGQDSNFNAYSTIISAENADSEKEQDKMFEEELLKLKNKATLRKCGALFSFCCYAKPYKENEYAILKRHFSSYPVLSIDVDGEIGWSTIEPNFEIELDTPPKRNKQQCKLPHMLHGWTSVLILITWGKKI